MAAIEDVWLAALTKGDADAGSRNRFNLTVNIGGADVFVHDFVLGSNLTGQGGTGLSEGQAGLERREPPAPFDSDALSNSSVRRVGAGTSQTIIRRVLMLIYTDSGSDIDTESETTRGSRRCCSSSASTRRPGAPTKL